MKRLAMVLALVAVGACQKAEQKPAQAPADTSQHMMMAVDTSKKMMMPDTSKKMAPAAKPAAKPAKKPAKKPAAKKTP